MLCALINLLLKLCMHSRASGLSDNDEQPSVNVVKGEYA